MTTFTAPPGLYRVDGDSMYLLASTSSVSDHLVFPAEPGQPIVELGPEGELYTWTSQEFRPPSPPALVDDRDSRYGVGYVEFPEGLRVEGRLTTCEPAELAIGGRMRVVTIPFAGGETFGFAPVGSDDVGIA